MNSCDDGRCLFFSLLFLIVTVLSFSSSSSSCFIRISYLVGYPADINEMNVRTPHIHRYESIHKTQFLSFNIIGCFSLILTSSPSSSVRFSFACPLVCLSVLCYKTLSLSPDYRYFCLGCFFFFSVHIKHAHAHAHTKRFTKDSSMRTTDNEV